MATEAETPKKASTGGFFSKIKGAVFQEAPDFGEAPKKQQPTAQAPMSALGAAPSNFGSLSGDYATTQVPSPSSAARAKMSEDYKKLLLGAVQAARIDSFDYLKFKAATQDLASDISDEKARFKAAFSTAKVLGISREKLIETAQHYVDVLDNQLKIFNEAEDGAEQKQVTGAQTQVESIAATIKAKREQIQKLGEEIETLQKDHTALVSKISDSRVFIENEKASFLATHGMLVQEIKNDINKLTEYLKTA